MVKLRHVAAAAAGIAVTLLARLAGDVLGLPGWWPFVSAGMGVLGWLGFAWFADRRAARRA